MDKFEKMLEAIDLLYGSILDESDYPKALESLANCAGARGVISLSFNPTTGECKNYQSHGVPAEAQPEYLGYFSERDIRVPDALHLPEGTFVTEQLVDQAVFHRSEIYGDFLCRHDVPHILSFWTEKSENTYSALSLQRSARQGLFDEGDQQRFAPLVSHVIRAHRIRELLGSVRRTQCAQWEVIDHLPFGVVFMDRRGHVTELSNAARLVIGRRRGLRYVKGAIRADHPLDDKALQSLIVQAISPSAPVAIRQSLNIRHIEGCTPLNVVAIPIRADIPLFERAPCAMLLIFDPESAPLPAVDIVRKTLRLTAAEARLACQLFTGISLREAAINMGISVNTCKTQLKSIYAKTGCRNHVDMARILAMTGMASSFMVDGS